MQNVRLDTAYTEGGETVLVRFDLSDEQLYAVAHAVDGVTAERYRGSALDAEGVLELRELVAVHDSALERARDGYSGGTLIVSLQRLGLIVGALRGWLERCERIGFITHQDPSRALVVEAMLGDLTDLHVRALRIAVGLAEPACAES